MISLDFVAGWEWPSRVAEEPAAYDTGRPTLYLDTSILSYLTARSHQNFGIARSQRITRVWWERYRRRYQLCISERVLTEAAAGDEHGAGARLNALTSITRLDPNAEAEALAELLVGKGVLPPRARADAEHIAIASAYSVRFLLTWNCRPMANPTVARNVIRTCAALELRCPVICTPETLMRTFSNERSLA